MIRYNLENGRINKEAIQGPQIKGFLSSQRTFSY